MDTSSTQSTFTDENILAVVKQYWGFDVLRPHQAQAILAGLEQRDSLVVLPTGGGKSLCYQAPAAIAGRTDVVVSPLISLMKDQVDGLRQCGYPATALNSGMTAAQQRKEEEAIAAGRYRLVFAAPERMVHSTFQRLLERINVRAFAIDEAHCISHWGHDFRPEYRQLALLKDRFPASSVHAYTATATERVRRDIVEQLGLNDPTILVGEFDRPNLVFRVVPRIDVYRQTLDVVRRHKNQAAIVYCISRKDTEEMAEHLRGHGCKAAYYHAGMTPEERRQTQDAFSEERLDIVVATVAFGMGIDRSDVRCVIHAAMPKSIEHYQQEAGRAGRDGLEAECVLFYSAADVMRWDSLIEKSAAEAESANEFIAASRAMLGEMQRLAGGARCRHRALSEYFGQEYPRENCNACDVCLGEMEEVADATVLAQKILSCVARVEQRFGAGHVADVLLGANTDLIRRCRHEQLSTYGILQEFDKKELTNLVHQLVDESVLVRTPGDRPILQLNEASWQVLRGQRSVRLLKPKSGGVKKTQIDKISWEGVDAGLFECLRQLRIGIAQGRGVPAFVIFGDATLREMARRRPGTLAGLAKIPGVGQKKLADLGERFVDQICAHCREHGLSLDETVMDDAPARPMGKVNRTMLAAHQLFRDGQSIEAVMAALGRARSTVCEYLAEYIMQAGPGSIESWVDAPTYARVAEAVRAVGAAPLKPIFEKLEGQVPYDTIRLVARHLETVGEADPSGGVKSARRPAKS